MSAFLANHEVMDLFTPGDHGSTFGGNPLACTVANSVLDIIAKKKFFKELNSKANFLYNELEKIKNENINIIEEIRGQCFLLGIKCKINNLILIDALRKNGLLVVGASENVIRLLPPLNIKKTEIIEAIKILKKTCTDLGLTKK